MKNLIYQYWIGTPNSCAKYSISEMKRYAEKVGAEHRFDHNPTFIEKMTPCADLMSSFRPVFDDQFHEYDNIVCLDCDFFPVKNFRENIFEEEVSDMAVCEEEHMPYIRKDSKHNEDERWLQFVKKNLNVDLPRTIEGLPRVYNGGLMFFTNQGLRKAKEKFYSMKKFVNLFRANFRRPLYYRDQAYMHVMFEYAHMNWRTLDRKWNSQLHNLRSPNKVKPVADQRKEDTQFVHLQLKGSDNWNKKQIDEVVNLPQSEWKLYVR